MKALQVTENGAPTDVLSVVDTEIPQPEANEVCVRVAAASLNFNDIDRVYGRRISVPTPPPFTLGMDVCGVVESAGEGAEHWVGKRVVAVTKNATGGLAEYAIAPATMTFDAPPSLSDVEATAFVMPFHTAYLAIVRRAKLQAGETLLVHAAASSVGAAAIQIARAIGARAIATVSSSEKQDYCAALNADLVINSSESDFVDSVMDFTSDRGAEVVLDLVGGDFVEQSWRCVALEGRYVAAGFAGDEQNGFTGKPLRLSCAGNFSIMGVTMSYVEALPSEIRRMGLNFFDGEVGEQVHSELLKLVAENKIRPNVGRIITLDAVADALMDQENRKTVGRTVVEI